MSLKMVPLLALLVAGCDTATAPTIPLTVGEGCTQGSGVTRNATTRVATVNLRITKSTERTVNDAQGVAHVQTVLSCFMKSCTFSGSLYNNTDDSLIDFCAATVA